MQVKNYVERKMSNLERKSYFCFYSSNGMFLDFGVSWLESPANNLIFVIYTFFDPFELKIKLLIAIMSLMVADKTREVLLIAWLSREFLPILLWGTYYFFWTTSFEISIMSFIILFQAYKLMMNKITRRLMDILNKTNWCKIWLKF